MAAKLDLTQLSIETTQQLSFIWNLVGVPEDERQAFLQALAEKVRAQYTTALESQQERQAAIEREINELQQRIKFLQEHCDTERGLPQGDHLSLTAYRDLLESTRAKVQGVWDARETELKALLEELSAASARVAEAIPAGFEAIGDKMTTGRIGAYKQQVAAVAKLQGEREARITSLCTEITDLWGDIEATPKEEEDSYSYKAVNGGASAITAAYGWGTSVITTLEEKLASVQANVDEREARLSTLGGQLTHYWHRLQTPEEEQRTFLEANSGISDATLEVVEATISRMKEEFQARLSELVARARGQIASCWDEMRAGPNQRKEMFASFFSSSDSYTEELFVEHEAYLQHCKAATEDMRAIIRGMEKRDELLKDKAEYTTIVSDPSRLLARGSSAARLREEKLEKRVKKELPAVLKKLREQVKEWETATGRPFLVEDVRFIDTLDEEDAKEAKEKGEARAARHGGAAAASAEAGSSASSSSSAAAAGAGKSEQRSTSNGRTAVARPVSSSSSAAAAALPTTLTRKASATASTMAPAAASAAAASSSAAPSEDPSPTGSSENAPAPSAAPTAAPIVATKRVAGVAAAVAAPAVPLRDTSSAKAPAGSLRVSIKPSTAIPLKVSQEAKDSAARMLGNL